MTRGIEDTGDRRRSARHSRGIPWRWIKWALFPVVVLILLAVGVFYDLIGQAQFDAAMAEARLSGGPVTFDEIQAARKVWPEDRNGAMVILRMTERLSTIAGELGDLCFKAGSLDEDDYYLLLGQKHGSEHLGERWDAETDRLVTEGLERWAGELARIDTLRDFEGGRFPLMLPPFPLDMTCDHLTPLRSAVELKHLQAVYRARHGNTEGALDDVSILVGLGWLLEGEPSLGSALLRGGFDTRTVLAIEQICAQAVLAPAQLRQLERELARIDNTNRMLAGVAGERAAMCVGMAEWYRAQPRRTNVLGGVEIPVPFPIPGTRGWLRREAALSMRLYGRLMAAVRQSEPSLDEIRKVSDEVHALGAEHQLTKTIADIGSDSCEIDVEANAVIRCGRAGLAVERYRIDKGNFPPRLDDLVPAYLDRVPVDPFDHQSLHYLVNAERAVVYSVGRDEVDDVGKTGDPGQFNRMTDKGFVLLAPRLRSRPSSATTRPAGSLPAEGRGSRPGR